MILVDMLDDYLDMCGRIPIDGAYAAYRQYTSRYHDLFDSVFQHLYCRDITQMRTYIESVDFRALADRAIRNRESGICCLIAQTAENCAQEMGVIEEFTLYLGAEMGNIGGAVLPSKADHPFLYFGTDRVLSEDEVRILIPHELHHMIRFSKLDVDPMSFCERVVSEGLGSYAPIHVYRMPYHADTIAKVLRLPLMHAERLIDDTELLIADILQKGDVSITPEIMSAYFTCSDPGQSHGLCGYYAGLHIVHSLVEAGESFEELTGMSASDVLQAYQCVARRNLT